MRSTSLSLECLAKTDGAGMPVFLFFFLLFIRLVSSSDLRCEGILDAKFVKAKFPTQDFGFVMMVAKKEC